MSRLQQCDDGVNSPFTNYSRNKTAEIQETIQFEASVYNPKHSTCPFCDLKALLERSTRSLLEPWLASWLIPQLQNHA